jgi:hypothetical protein
MKSPIYHPAVNNWLAAYGILPRYVTGLDSGVTLMQALAHYLHGRDLPLAGSVPAILAPVVVAANRLPAHIRSIVYGWSGRLDAIGIEQIENVEMETISRWATSQYPRRRYPAAMIGSANGAAVHLCAALGIPWLPQTYLISVRRSLHPDEGEEDLAWGQQHAHRFLRTNPHIRVYQQHDPNQDRLMVRHMAYFRLKQLRLSRAYKEFLKETLAPGAILYLIECQYSWQATRLDDRPS